MTDKEVDVKQEVIDGVAEKLAKEGTFATRDFVHSELMDAMKSVIVTPDLNANGELTPKQEAEGKAAWYRQCVGKGLAWEAKAWTSATSGAAAELIPTIVANSIVAKLDNSPFRKVVTQYPYSPKGTINAEDTLPLAYRMLAGKPVTEAAPTLTPITYSTSGIMAWMGIDNDLIRNATVRTVPYIEDALVRAIGRRETYEWTKGIHGGATFEMTGMIGRATAVDMAAGHDTLAEIDKADILNLFWALDALYADNPVLIAPNSFLAKISSLNDPLVVGGQSYFDIGTMKFLGGLSVIRMPESCFDAPADTKVAAYFGDPKAYYLFSDGPIQIATTDVGKTAMTMDQTYIAAKVYTDGNLIQPLAMVALKYNTA